jgi:hypothetical protein
MRKYEKLITGPISTCHYLRPDNINDLEPHFPTPTTTIYMVKTKSHGTKNIKQTIHLAGATTGFVFYPININ